jgi:hypothetical protein
MSPLNQHEGPTNIPDPQNTLSEPSLYGSNFFNMYCQSKYNFWNLLYSSLGTVCLVKMQTPRQVETNNVR